MTMKKVAHYFSDHSITVASDAPLSEILHNRDATGRVAKWAIELLPLDIKFEAKKAIKSQAIADFLAEWIEQQQPTEVHSEHWTMFFDGSKMLNGSGAGVVLVSPLGDRLSYVLQIHFDSSNNEAEYEALLYGLRMAISLDVCRLMVYGDSDLVVNQVLKVLGNVVISKKILRTRKIMVMHSNERGECCPRTLVDRKWKR